MVNEARRQEYMIKREAVVVKANELIQKSRFSLSAPEQKIILYLISRIKKEDEYFKEYEFSINEFIKICGLEKGGNTYKEIKEQIKRIADKSLWITKEDGTASLVRWIEKAKIDNTGFIRIRLDEDMKPYLLQLKEHYTMYELIYTLNLKSKYSIRLYELIQSIQYDKLNDYTREYEIEEFKRLLGAEGYSEYKDLKKRVIVPCVEEISKYSDKEIQIEKIVEGRKVKAIKLVIHSKSLPERMKLLKELDEEMLTKQISLWEGKEIDDE